MSEPYKEQAAGCASYARDIRPKFTPEDISHMKPKRIDLSSHADVAKNADLILERLKDPDDPMPPKPRGPWPPDWIKCFEDWIKNGKLP